MTDALDLMRMQADVLFTHDANGRMVRVNDVGAPRAPRLFLGRTAEGHVWRFRNDVDVALCTELEQAIVNEPRGDEFLRAPYGASVYRDLLAQREPVMTTFEGPAYRFPAQLPSANHTVIVTK